VVGLLLSVISTCHFSFLPSRLPPAWPCRKAASVNNLSISPSPSSFPFFHSLHFPFLHSPLFTFKTLLGPHTCHIHNLPLFHCTLVSVHSVIYNCYSTATSSSTTVTRPESSCDIMTSPGPRGPSPEKIVPIFAAALQGETSCGSPLASVTVS
jgi:hypothetical protein